jgi:ribosome-associated protein
VKDDLRVPPGPGLPDGLVVAAADLVERFSRSSGPGGQGVNTTDSRVQLSLDVATASSLSDVERERLLRRLEARLDGTVLTVDASQHRAQRRNRVAARERLAEIIREALAPPPPRRRPTRRTRGSQLRRLEAKRRRGETKAGRGRPARDD